MKIIESFVDNIKQKTTNPFFGTLILVWLVRNWELVYTLFNFDNDCTLSDKKQFIRDYYVSKFFWKELLLNIGIALCLMILGYILIVITRVFVNWIDHKIVPELNLKFVSKLVVSNTRFEESEKLRIDNYNALLIERENLNKLEVKINELKATISKLDLDLAGAYMGNSNLTTEKAEINKKYNEVLEERTNIEKAFSEQLNDLNILKMKLNLVDSLSKAKQQLYVIENISPFTFDLYIKLEEKDSATVFFYYAYESIDKKTELEAELNPDFIDYFVENNIIHHRATLEGKEHYKVKNLELTEYGKDLVKNRKLLESYYRDAIINSQKLASITKL